MPNAFNPQPLHYHPIKFRGTSVAYYLGRHIVPLNQELRTKNQQLMQSIMHAVLMSIFHRRPEDPLSLN